VFSLSPIKIMVIVAVVLVLLGPDKLPEVAHKLGSGWRALKRIQERVEAEVREVVPDLPSTSAIARIARSPVNLLNSLADRADARDADRGGDNVEQGTPTPDFDFDEVEDQPPPTPSPAPRSDFPPSADPSLN
jgi:TatA/E family protein of Tat protein translocase